VPGDLVYDLTAGENGRASRLAGVGGYGESVGAIWWTGDGRTWNLTHDPEVSQFVTESRRGARWRLSCLGR
jgi:hypothetical protein